MKNLGPADSSKRGLDAGWHTGGKHTFKFNGLFNINYGSQASGIKAAVSTVLRGTSHQLVSEAMLNQSVNQSVRSFATYYHQLRALQQKLRVK